MNPRPTAANYSFAFDDQQRRGIYPRGAFRRVGAAVMLQKNRPTYFQRNLEHLLLTARHNEVQPVLATFAYTEREKGGDVSSTREIRDGIDEINRVLVRLGAAFEVPVFDFAASFPADPELFVGGVHLNAKGAKLKADLFAAYLSESGLIPRQ